MPASIHFNDILLVFVVISSMALAVIFPDFGFRFRMLPYYCLMIIFFLSYLSIDIASIWTTLKSHSTEIAVFSITKLVILPVVFYFAFYFIAPGYALSALLLTGVSVGVVAPMISNMVHGNSALVLVIVVITSVAAPFTLPAVVKIIASKDVTISFMSMLQMLATVIFVPIIVVEIIRHLLPRLVKPILKIRFPASLVLFAVINLGVFYRYASFFKNEPWVILMSAIVVFVLAAIYCVIGIVFFRKSSLEDKLAGAVMLGNLNNVLIIVFSSEFFGPVEPLVAAMYTIPFWVIVIPLRYYRNRMTRAI
ncbi:MAG: bile acid:sodium symporter [Syntrophorhabdus sp.]|nr:bile acid:sodium symporter [Syntrophorhabdus sp.]